MTPTSFRRVAVDDAPLLPERSGPAARPFGGPELLTGGGLAALVSAERGMVALVDGSGSYPVPGDAEGIAGTGTGTGTGPGEGHVGPGSWWRALPDGGEERGLLLDAFPIVVVQRLGQSGTETLLLTPSHVSAETLSRAVASLQAHALRRRDRGTPDGAFALEGPPPPLADRVAQALGVLDDASLHDPSDPSTPRGLPVVAGVVDGAPRLLEGAPLVEVALGALAAGRRHLAFHLLARTLADREIPAGARLFLAARWALWTGEPTRLRPFLGALDEAARSVAETPEPDGVGLRGLPAAFPSLPALLGGFADAVEPLGNRGWTGELRALARTAGERVGASPGGGAPLGGGGPSGRGIRLPVLGQAAAEPDAPAGPRPTEPALPPVHAFASPHHPSVAPRRTLHAARFLRSAVEGLMGVRPDASYGRVVLAPDLVAVAPSAGGVRRLAATGIRVGDARLSLDCRVEGGHGTLRVCQTAGRVPVTVIFEPFLPLGGVDAVRMGGDPAEVEIDEREGGVRLRFQFPLDPERSVSVDGTA